MNAWVKQGILLGFRHGDLADASMDHGRLPFFDKDTLPLKRLDVAAGVRIVPGGSAIRDGAFLGRGVIAMPPMYVNIGAYVDEGSMIDSHALVGSCAQVGKRVHVSAGAQIGGVLEPVGALPVCVEDDVLLGGLTGLFEGTVVKRRAVIAAGTILTGSTPVYDLPNGRVLRPEGGLAARGPRGRGRRARGARGHGGRRPRLGPVARDTGDREVPRREDGRPHGAGSVAALSLVDLARALVDIDSTTGREAEACAWLAGYLRERGFRVTEQPVSGGRFNIVALVDPRPAVVLSTHVDCVPPFFPSRVEGGRLHGRGACDAKGALAAQVTAAERLRESGEGRVGLLFVVGEERGSDGATAANRISPGPAFLVNGEPTESKLGLATRGAFRVKLRATGAPPTPRSPSAASPRSTS